MSNRAQKPAGSDIYPRLFDAILEQRLVPGTRLTEDSLAEIFKVSRTTIRRALQQLAHDNIVEIRPHRGAVVARPTVREAREIFEARRLMEGWIAKSAAAHCTTRDISRLRKLVSTERAYYDQGDRGSWIRSSGEFHVLLARIADNELLCEILQELIPRTSLVIAQYEVPGTTICSHDEHAHIIDVIATGDGPAAAQAMHQHLVRCETKLALSGERVTPDLRSALAIGGR